MRARSIEPPARPPPPRNPESHGQPRAPDTLSSIAPVVGAVLLAAVGAFVYRASARRADPLKAAKHTPGAHGLSKEAKAKREKEAATRAAQPPVR